MQKTFYILLSLLFCTSFHTLHAQDIPNPGDYFRNDQIDRFAGNWKWQSGDSTVLVQLRKEVLYLRGGQVRYDGLNGDIRYVLGDQTIRDSFNANKRAIMGLGGFSANNEVLQEIKLLYSGIGNERSGDIILKCLDNDCNTLQWELRESPGIKVYLEGEPWPQDFLLPRRMVLTREAPARRPQGN